MISPGLLALCHAHSVHQCESAWLLRGWVRSPKVIIQCLQPRHTNAVEAVEVVAAGL
jgi:hypothetical protein